MRSGARGMLIKLFGNEIGRTLFDSCSNSERKKERERVYGLHHFGVGEEQPAAKLERVSGLGLRFVLLRLLLEYYLMVYSGPTWI